MTPKREFSRRDFLRTTLAGAAGAGVFGLESAVAGQTKTAAAPAVAGKFITRTLGKTGFRLPVVSMGVMNADSHALVRRAYELGIRHFDTAASYARGRNEEMVGNVLKELGARDKVVIATKVMTPQFRRGRTSEQVKAAYLEALEGSLRRLQTETVDILYVHDISDAKEVGDPGLLEGMAAAKKLGKARGVGFSTHQNMGACLDEAVRLGCFDAILTAYNYAHHPDTGLLESMNRAAASGIGLIAMKTQCQQDWYRYGLPAELQEYYKGAVVHTALLKWVLNHDCITTAVPGFVNFDQLETDISCAPSLAYTPVEKKFLEDRQVKLAMTRACRQCGRCSPTCPFGADVLGLMRAHMYAFSYGKPIQARETLDGKDGRRGLDACRNCDSCRASCSGDVRIGRRIEQLKEAFA